MKVYALGFLDGDGQGLAVWEGDINTGNIKEQQDKMNAE